MTKQLPPQARIVIIGGFTKIVCPSWANPQIAREFRKNKWVLGWQLPQQISYEEDYSEKL